jgi:hypothetical protein
MFLKNNTIHKNLLIFSFILFSLPGFNQNLGGSATYNFVKLAPAPLISALGGSVIAVFNDDANLCLANPALLNEKQTRLLGVNASNLYDGIKHLSAQYSSKLEAVHATGNIAVNFINYGKTPQTDASGNMIGQMNPTDYYAQFSISKKYLQKWQYGAAFKYIGSNYGTYHSSAVAMDLGLAFTDSGNGLRAGLVFKNIGFQVKKYSNGEALPFDFQMGFCKKLERAPVQFIFTATNLHQFDIRYADTVFENEINGVVKKGKFTIDKLFRHLIFGAQIYPSEKLEFTIAYNYLRRKELTLYNAGNGVTGLSFGAGILFKAYQFRFAKAFYQNTRAYNQIGLVIDFNRLHL